MIRLIGKGAGKNYNIWYNWIYTRASVRAPSFTAGAWRRPEDGLRNRVRCRSPVTSGYLWGRFNDPLMRSTDHAQPLHKFIFSCNKYIVRFRGQLSISWSLECVEQKKLPENWGQPDQIAFATGFIPGRIHRVLLVHGPSDLQYIIPVSAFSNLHELD